MLGSQSSARIPAFGRMCSLRLQITARMPQNLQLQCSLPRNGVMAVSFQDMQLEGRKG